jgi:hypothetical protein
VTDAPWPSLLSLVAGVAASAFAVAQLALRQHRAMTDRFVTFVETSLAKHEEAMVGFRDAVAHLDDGVRENTLVVQRMSERLGVDPCP